MWMSRRRRRQLENEREAERVAHREQQRKLFVSQVLTTKPTDGFASDTCLICLDILGDGRMMGVSSNCGHRFHRECLVDWLVRNQECPVCRKDFLFQDAELGLSAQNTGSDTVSESPSERGGEPLEEVAERNQDSTSNSSDDTGVGSFDC